MSRIAPHQPYPPDGEESAGAEHRRGEGGHRAEAGQPRSAPPAHPATTPPLTPTLSPLRVEREMAGTAPGDRGCTR